MGLRGGEDENNAGRGFLQGLKEGIECLGGQHMDFIDDEDLRRALCRGILHVFPEFPDFIDPPVGSSVYLEHIHRSAR